MSNRLDTWIFFTNSNVIHFIIACYWKKKSYFFDFGFFLCFLLPIVWSGLDFSSETFLSVGSLYYYDYVFFFGLSNRIADHYKNRGQPTSLSDFTIKGRIFTFSDRVLLAFVLIREKIYTFLT